MIFRPTLLLLISLTLYMQPVAAVKIVRLQLEYGGEGVATGGFAFPKATPVLDLELYDDITPGTVTNYLNYVNDGRYDTTVINRSIPGFVLQTGGVTYNVADPDATVNPINFVLVPADSQIDNEASLSNLRGTIAMAKIPVGFNENGCTEEGPGCTLDSKTGPDSATSEWYINLKNNSNPLDTENGGFTVFGNVVDDNMKTVDEIALFPVSDVSFIFGPQLSPFATDIPFADFDPTGGEFRFKKNLVMIISATEINRPIMRFSPIISDFGFISPNSQQLIDVILTNTGDEVLNVSAIDSNAINAPFSIQSENCFGSPLQPVSITPTASCTIRLVFSPTVLGQFNESLLIEYTGQSGEVFSVTYALFGEASAGPPVISVPAKFNVGISQIDGIATQEKLLVTNIGNASLKITNLSGLDATNFSQVNDCIDNVIAVNEFCTITVDYAASDFGLQSTTLTITSNDPENSSTTVILNGFGDTDSDGVLSAIEQAGPNQGDGNNDGVSDDLQNNVVSFELGQGLFLTLAAEDAQIAENLGAPSEVAFTRVKLLDTIPAEAPITSFDYGNYQFDINLPNNGIAGDAVRMALFFPIEVKPSAYYRYGSTPDNTEPHWYNFSFDAETQTGAVFVGEVSIPSELGGTTISRNMVILNFIDGARGDDDLIANNGKISHSVGGVEVQVSAGSSSGAAVYLWLFFLLLLLCRRRHFITSWRGLPQNAFP